MIPMSTPRRVSTRLSTAGASPDSAAHTPSPRKKPHCTKCGEPMLGHKRSQCSNNALARPLETTNPEPHAMTDVFAHFDSLRIMDEDKPKDDIGSKGRRRTSLKQTPVKPETVMSLASHDKNALDALLKPGMMSDEVGEFDEEKARESIERWLEKLSTSKLPEATPKKVKARNSMPPAFSPIKALERKRLGRDMDRSAFYRKLMEKSDKRVASVYTMNADDIRELEAHAKRLKIKAKGIYPKYANGEIGDGWLVIGQDSESIEQMFKRVENEAKSEKGYLLGGAALGAVATWTILAIS